jgi:PHP family Zn ribbon phosphoesterase
MKYAVDLHIHSALSPCSDNDMTPNNIINMALLKGLDIIAVTDHNSAENVRAFIECAAGKDILVIPGMELETKEEVHLVCLFPEEEKALKMQETVYRALPYMLNRADIFGQQLIIDKQDNITGTMERMLLRATELGVEDVVRDVNALGGVVIPAHVDRNSYSILSNLGTIPDSLDIGYLEISHNCDISEFVKVNPHLSGYGFISDSDAHILGDILERESFLELEEKSAFHLVEKLRKAK